MMMNHFHCDGEDFRKEETLQQSIFPLVLSRDLMPIEALRGVKVIVADVTYCLLS
jgi:hypothetical protein